MSTIELCPTCLRPASLRKAAEIDIQSRQAEADRLNAFVASMEAAVCHAVGVDPVAVRLAAIEADAKQAREDEAWAKANKAVIDSEPVDKCWCAMVVREDGPLIDVPSANGRTIAEALRALREKVEGGTP